MSTLTAALPDLAHAPRQRRPQHSPGAVALIVAAHGGLLAWLVAQDIVPIPRAVSALMVEMIQASRPEAMPQVTPPKPRPVDPKPRRQPATPPILATQADAASTTTAAPVANEPTVPAASPNPAHTLPRFDADYLSNPPPHYPPLSRRKGEEGRVQLRVLVDAGGRPSQIELKTSSGSQRLDQAAQEAVWRWQFVPARRGEEAIAAWVMVPIIFTLKQ